MLEVCDVALEVQRDVAQVGSGQFEVKREKSVNHVVLGGSDVALGVQHDVAGQGSGHFEVKREEKREPCCIGSVRCHVGGPTRRGETRMLAIYKSRLLRL